MTDINTQFGEKFKRLFQDDEFLDNEIDIINTIFNDYVKDVKKSNKAKSKNHYAYLKKPDICDELISTTELVHPWYNHKPEKEEERQVIEDPALIKEIEMRKEREIYSKLIDEFCNTYYNINERDPFQREIIDNMKSKYQKQYYSH